MANRAFDQRNHAIEKRVARAGRNLDNDPIGEHQRSARHTRPVAARFANNRGGFTRDCRFVNRCDSFDDFSIARHDLTGFNDDSITGLQCRRNGRFDGPI